MFNNNLRLDMAIKINTLFSSGYNPSNITVVNKYKENYDVYIGRGSLWGNPFPVADYGREPCIQMYREYILKRLREENGMLMNLLNLQGKKLGCFCKPKHCHGDELQQILNHYLDTGSLPEK